MGETVSKLVVWCMRQRSVVEPRVSFSRDQPSLCSDVLCSGNPFPTRLYTMLPVIDKQTKGPELGQLSAGSG